MAVNFFFLNNSVRSCEIVHFFNPVSIKQLSQLKADNFIKGETKDGIVTAASFVSL